MYAIRSYYEHGDEGIAYDRHENAPVLQPLSAEAVAAGGSTLKDHRLPDGGTGYFQMTFRVYDREGAPCPSGKLV